MKEAVVVSVSEIQTDEHGYTFIELELSDGAQGFFPNKVEFLELFYEGVEVKYREVKTFNNRPKIIGLLPNKKEIKRQMLTGRIVDVSPWEFSNKKSNFYATVTLDDSTSGIVMVDSMDDTVRIKPGVYITYDLSEMKDHKFLVGVSTFGYSPAIERDLSIKRQVAFKAAVELLNANPIKGRWADKDSPTGLNTADMVRDVQTLTEALFNIVN